MDIKPTQNSQTVIEDNSLDSLEDPGTIVHTVGFSTPPPNATTSQAQIQTGQSGMPPKSHNLGAQLISWKRAMRISGLAALIIVILASGVGFYQSKHHKSGGQSASEKIPSQNVSPSLSLKSKISTDITTDQDSLLVNGDIITHGALKVVGSTHSGLLTSLDLTSNQTYSLPNASGVICLDSNNCGYVTPAQFGQLQQSLAAQLNTGSGSASAPAPAADGGVKTLQGLSGAITLQGNANQLSVSGSGSTITLSLPQDIGLGSSPTFSALTLSSYGPGQVLVGNGSGALLGIAPTAGAQCLVSLNTTTVVFGSCVGGPAAAAVELNNLSNVAINTSLLSGSATIDLGSAVNSFRDLYLSGGANVGGTLVAGFLQGDGSALTNLNASNVSSGTLAVAYGGTGVGTIPTNGQLLIGNGTGYSVGGLTSSDGSVIITNGSGTIDLGVSTDYAPTSGSGNYIQNQVAGYQAANFQIQSAAPSNIGAVIKGATDQTADLLQLQSDRVPFPVLGVGAGGAVTIRNTDDSTTAFSIQNASGYTILGVDSTANSSIITNRSFDVNSSGWQYSGSPGSIAQTAAQHNTGVGSLMINTTANPNNGAKYITGNTNPTQLVINTTYDISWYDKLDPSSGSPFTTVLAAYAVDGSTEVPCTAQNTSTVTTTGWTRHNCTIATDGTLPAANAYFVIKQSDTTARTFYVDDVQIADPYSSRLHVTDVVPLAAGQVNGTKIYTLDSSGTMGSFSSMAIGTDGLARISYYDGTKTNLKFIQCLSDDCTVHTPTANTFIDDGFNGVNSNAEVGRFNSIALGPGDLPRFSYYDGNALDLKYAACVVQDCSSGTVIKKLAVAGSVGRFSQIAIGPDGYARIIYNDLSDTSLKFIRCPDADCTVPVDSALTIEANYSPGNSSGSNALYVGSNGVYIAYYESTIGRLKFVHCLATDPDCLSPSITTIEPTRNVGLALSMAVGSDGFARLAYYTTSTPHRVTFVRCQDADCSSYTTPKIVDSRGDYGLGISIKLDTNDWPRISYKNNSTGNGNLLYAKCLDINCAQITLPLTPVDSTANLSDSSLVITPSGLGVTPNVTRIVYNDTVTGDLRFAVLNTDSGGEEISGGFSLGTAALPFNKLSVRSIDLQGGLVVNNAGRTGLSAITIKGGGTYINAQDESDNKNLVVTQDTFQYVATNTTTNAFQIGAYDVNGAVKSIFLVNSKNNHVGINNITPAFDLDITGDLNLTGAYRIDGIKICDFSGCIPSSSSGIQNGTTIQSANFAISSAVVGTDPSLPTAVLQKAAGQTGNLLQVQDVAGASILASIAANGDISTTGTLTLGKAGPAGTDGAIVFKNAAGANTVTLLAPATDPAGPLSFRLPSADGGNGQCLVTNGSGALSFNACTANGVYVQGGNSFGADADLGTNDNFGLNLRTNGITRLSIDTAGATTISSALTVQGATATVGTNVLQGSLVLNDGSNNTGTIKTAALAQNTVYTLPDPGGATANICLSTGNCAGAGGGITGSGTAGTLTKFTGTGNTVGNSIISESGTSVTAAGTLIATFLQGDGSGLTNLNGANLTVTTVANAALVNSSLDVVAGDGLADGGTVALGSATTLNIGAGDGITVGADDVAVDSTVCRTTGNCLGGGSGAANTSLSNLSSVAINVNLLPGSSTIDLGSTTAPFRDLYLGGTATNNIQITGTSIAARVYTLPDVGANANFCLSTGNCAGAGGAVIGSGTSGQLTKFTGTGTVGDSSLSESGTTITATGNLVIQGTNALTLGTAGPAGNAGAIVFRNAAGSNTVTLQAPNSNPASSLTFSLPGADGIGGECLKTDGSGGLSFSGCIGGTYYIQGGNSFGATANLGTNDNFGLNLRTNGITRLSVDTSGNAVLTGGLQATTGAFTASNSLALGTASIANGKISFYNNSNNNVAVLQSGTTGPGNLTLSLPAADGLNSDCLKTDGLGQLSFGTCLNGGGSGGGVTFLNGFAGAVTIQGTANRVTVASGSNIIGLSTPQDIGTVSSPIFASLRVGTAPVSVTTVTDNPLASGATTVNVVSTTGYPVGSATNPATLLIDSELMTYTGVTTTSFTGVTRGAFGTTAAAHVLGSSVEVYLVNIGTSAATAPKLVVTGSGKVGIGTSSPTAKLHVDETTATTGNLVSLTSSNASQTTATILSVAQSGVTTGFTGNVINIQGTSTTGTGNLVNLSSANTTNGSALNIAANSADAGSAVLISTTALTSGAALKITGPSGASALSNGVLQVSATGNYTGTGGLLNLQATTSTAGTLASFTNNTAAFTGTGVNLSMTGITAGDGFLINPGAGLTTGSAFKVSATGTSAISQGLVQIFHNGAYTNTGGLLNVQATNSTAGTLVNFTNNKAAFTGTGLNLSLTGTTTGNDLLITPGNGVTSGSALKVSAGGTSLISGGLVQITHSGAYTGSAGLLNILANSTNTGTLANFAGSALTTGTVLSLQGGNNMKTGGIFSVGSNTNYNHNGGGNEIGNLVNLTFNENSSGAGDPTTNGLNVTPTINMAVGNAASGIKTINAIKVSPATLTACAGGQTCVYTGLNIDTTGSLANTTIYAALFNGGNVGINTTTPTGGNLDIRQRTNGDTVLYAKRNTDTSPTGKFLQLQDATSVDLASIDIAGNLTVKNATVNGTLTVNGHFKSTQTTAPTIGTPANCGVTPTAAVTAGSTDSAGSITITAGTGAPTTCDTIITFNAAYGAAPKSVMLTSKSATGGTKNIYVSATSTTTFTTLFNTSPAAGEANSYYYWVIE